MTEKSSSTPTIAHSCSIHTVCSFNPSYNSSIRQVLQIIRKAHNCEWIYILSLIRSELTSSNTWAWDKRSKWMLRMLNLSHLASNKCNSIHSNHRNRNPIQASDNQNLDSINHHKKKRKKIINSKRKKSMNSMSRIDLAVGIAKNHLLLNKNKAEKLICSWVKGVSISFTFLALRYTLLSNYWMPRK